MQHQSLRKVAGILVASMALLALMHAVLLAPGEAPAPASPVGAVGDGRVLFERRCGRCHEAGELLLQPGDSDAAAALVSFLGRHARAPLEEDLRIVAWLSESRD